MFLPRFASALSRASIVSINKGLQQRRFWTYFKQLDVNGKAILITGSGAGFGHDFAIRCAEKGMTVFAGCLSPSSVVALQDKASRLPGKMIAFQMDVSNQESIDRSLPVVEENLKPGQGLHAVVNNAGIMKVGFDDWISADDFEACLKVNTFGGIRVTEKFKHLVKREQGRVIMVSSIAGRISLPGFGPYIVSKFAVEAYADTIRRELHPFGVKVAIIEPGFHRTAITDLKHWVDLFAKAWERAPENIKKEYGGVEFLEKYNALLDRLLNSRLNSTHVEHVVDTYFEAISATYPRNRYPVGKDARFFWIPLSNMPAWIQDPVLRAFLGMFAPSSSGSKKGAE